jgi:ferritin-like metal-binding protein YciE
MGLPQIKDPKDLFVHQLGEALNMERTVLTMLKKNEQTATEPQLKRLFAHHRDETEGQIQNLEQAFSSLGVKPAGHTCHAMEGMKKEAQDLVEKSAPELVDGVLAGGATHVEHYEIATYEGLITKADAMGADDVVALLQENLEQEQHTLNEVQTAAEALSKREAQQIVR